MGNYILHIVNRLRKELATSEVGVSVYL